MVREYTSRMIDLNDQGYFDKDRLILDLLNWMPEGDSPEQEEEDYEYYNRLEAERDIYGDNALEEDFA